MASTLLLELILPELFSTKPRTGESKDFLEVINICKVIQVNLPAARVASQYEVLPSVFHRREENKIYQIPQL